MISYAEEQLLKKRFHPVMVPVGTPPINKEFVVRVVCETLNLSQEDVMKKNASGKHSRKAELVVARQIIAVLSSFYCGLRQRDIAMWLRVTHASVIHYFNNMANACETKNFEYEGLILCEKTLGVWIPSVTNQMIVKYLKQKYVDELYKSPSFHENKDVVYYYNLALNDVLGLFK